MLHLISAGERSFKSPWHMAETENRKFDRRKHFEILARPHQAFEMSGASQVFFNRSTERAQADAFQHHPNFQRAETARKFRPVIPESKRLIGLLLQHPGV